VGSVRKRPDGRYRARYRGPDGRERARHFALKRDAERWVATNETAKAKGDWIDPDRGRVGPATSGKALLVLSQCVQLAIRDVRLSRDPTVGVRRPRQVRGRQRVLTHGEVEKLAGELPAPYGCSSPSSRTPVSGSERCRRCGSAAWT
jgi:hypothetical protein